jgi:4-methyl-5(b-hydroxyethyl)-thiazole monophosphate biosynthesis
MADVKKAFVFLTDGFEEIEALSVIDILRRAKVVTVTVSITGNGFVTSAQGVTVKADAFFSDFGFDDGDALILPGGPGTASYNDCAELIGLIKDYNEKGRLVAAVCAAPTVLAKAGILDGKTAVCYDMDALPAEVAHGDGPTVRDGNVITSRAASTSAGFAFAIVEYLVGKDTADTVRKRMMFDLFPLRRDELWSSADAHGASPAKDSVNGDNGKDKRQR